MRIILASSSPYRRALLTRLGVTFETISPDVDESPRADESPAALAMRLAETKARAVADSLTQSAIVIGSDQVADFEGTPVGKPGTRERACQQLQAAAARTVMFHTGVSVVADGQCTTRVDTTQVHFRALSEAEIMRYLDYEQPYDCAGSFKAEGLGVSLFTAIESNDPTALIGLPLITLAELLRQAGLALP